MSAVVLPFRTHRRVTGDALLYARRYHETRAALRRGIEEEAFLRNWLEAFEAECRRDAPALQAEAR